MAQTIASIKKEMTDYFISLPENISKYQLTAGKTFEDEFSTVSIESIFFSTVAFCVWTLQKLFDTRIIEVADMIKNTRLAYTPWLIGKAKSFQFGYNLIPDGIDYDNTGIAPELIEASKVVKYAAIVELRRGLRIKLATESGGDLAPLPNDVLEAFKAYFKRIKPFCAVKFVNQVADRLKLKLKIYYNPQVLSEFGARLDGNGANPIGDGIVLFLKNQPFNGLFVLTELLVSLRAIDGVVIPSIVEASAKYGALDYQPVDDIYLPDAGYLRIYDLLNDLEIQFIPHEPI